MECSSNAILSTAATKPWVGRTQAVGQRVIPLVRMNSATASQSFSGMIHPMSSRALGRAVIVEFSARLSRGSAGVCDGMLPFVSIGKMVNAHQQTRREGWAGSVGSTGDDFPIYGRIAGRQRR